MNFKNLTLVKKLGIGFGMVILIVAISSVYVLKQTRDLAETERLNSLSDTVVDLTDQLEADTATVRAAGYKLIISGDQADKPQYLAAKQEFNKDFANIKDILEKEAPQFVGDLMSLRTMVVDKYFETVLEDQTAIAKDPANRDRAFAAVASKAATEAREGCEVATDLFRTRIDRWSDDLTAQSNTSMVATEWIVAVSGAITVITGLLMAWFIARSVGGPINLITATMRSLASGDNKVEVPAREQTNEIGLMAGAVQVFKEAAIEKLRLEAEAASDRQASQAEREHVEAERAVAAKQQAEVVEKIAGGLNKLASGDLLQRIDQPFASEYESLRVDFNSAVVQLQKTIKDVMTSTGTIRSGTGEIANASDDLSRRTEQQAANLEETAAALTEISSAMKRTAEGASHAREVVSVAHATADKSNEVIARTTTAMGSIASASQQISQIIGVIDEIAFQTNLLALNAGVEAARAGEAGRGFAVVASEVRALAQRCAEAAKEVKALVRASAEHVSVGVDLVGESGKMLAQIVAQVSELKGIVNDIAASAEQQAAGLSEVNIAVTQLDHVTQQNAAMAEEATAAAHHLAQEGSELVRLVEQFNVGTADVAVAYLQPAAAVSKPVPRTLALKKTVGGRARAMAEDWD